MKFTLFFALITTLAAGSEGLTCYSCDDVLTAKPGSCKDLSKVETQECDNDNPICMHTVVVGDDMGRGIYTTRGCGRLEDEEQDKVGQCMDKGPTAMSIKKRFISTIPGMTQRSSVWVCTCNNTNACNGAAGVKMGTGLIPGVGTTILVAVAAAAIGWMGFMTYKL